MNEPVHVLVVDDAGDLRDRVCMQIAELGFRCEAVDTAADALAVLDWWRPLVVIVEWDLRDGSGVGLSRKLRAWADDGYRPLLVILYSEREQATEAYDEYIKKPAAPQQLESLIVKFLAG